MLRIGLIGGSGLETLQIFENQSSIDVETKYGKTSSPLKTGIISGVEIAFISRHGEQHTITPTHVPYRANILALKDAGCQYILATTAVGSLREDIHRGDLIIFDQFIDFTKLRVNTFYEEFEPGSPVHASMSKPFDEYLRGILISCCNDLKFPYHPCGTVVTIEGPRFSTRAESFMFRTIGCDAINMSIATEAALANEVNIPYVAIGMSTDYDSWRDDEEGVTWEAISNVFKQNVSRMNILLIKAIEVLGRNYGNPKE